MLLFTNLTFARPDLDLFTMLPVAVLGLLMILILAFELRPEPLDSEQPRSLASMTAAAGFLVLFAYYFLQPTNTVGNTFQGMLANDPMSRWAGLLICVCGFLAILAGQEELIRHRSPYRGEFVALTVGACLGMVMMASALNTIVLFLGLELFSIALYLLCIFFPDRASSRESGMKYFLLSSAASAILLYGLALLYGATGSTWIGEMPRDPASLNSSLALMGGVFVLCGLLFKLAAVPFHFWAPDVYEGAPTTVTAFMSVATKVAALVALWRLFVFAAPELGERLTFILTALAICSMVLGHLMALAQTRVKRMLAYSGIGNAGYLLIAPAAGIGMEGPLMFFLASYLFGNMGAFLALASVENRLQREVLRDDLRGLVRCHPVLAVAFAISLASLAGLPPLAGFLGKFYLFGKAIDAGWVTLTAVAIGCSVIAAGYYLGTALSLFEQQVPNPLEAVEPPPSPQAETEASTSLNTVALALCTAGTVVLGLFPGAFMAWLNSGL